ncbi:MAG: desulfoferrodoxin family protein [Bacteroidota bacterium]
MRKIFLILMIIAFLLCVIPLMADKSSVTIDAPDTVEKGQVITIVIKVTHDGNNILHHTNWVYVKANGEQIARWEYTWTSLPEQETFEKKVTYAVNDSLTIEAEANCNIHGSEGLVRKEIQVK